MIKVAPSWIPNYKLATREQPGHRRLHSFLHSNSEMVGDGTYAIVLESVGSAQCTVRRQPSNQRLLFQPMHLLLHPVN